MEKQKSGFMVEMLLFTLGTKQAMSKQKKEKHKEARHDRRNGQY